MVENNKGQLARMEEQIKNLGKENNNRQEEFKTFVCSFHKFKDNDFHHLKLDVEKLKMSLQLNNKLTWVILVSILGIAIFIIKSTF